MEPAAPPFADVLCDLYAIRPELACASSSATRVKPLRTPKAIRENGEPLILRNDRSSAKMRLQTCVSSSIFSDTFASHSGGPVSSSLFFQSVG